jgi:hypothetical protein
MTTARSVVAERATAGKGDIGPRRRRRLARRRLVREEILAVLVLVAALAATLVLLGLQWLNSGGSNPPTGTGVVSIHFLGGFL